jgi:hypothetical protein
MVFSRSDNLWIPYTDTQDDESERSIPSEAAVNNSVNNNNGNDNDNENENGDNNHGRIHDKKQPKFSKLRNSFNENKHVNNTNTSSTKIRTSINENNKKHANDTNNSFASLPSSVQEIEHTNKVNKSVVNCWKSNSDSLEKYWRNCSNKKRMIIILSVGFILLLIIVIIGASVGTTTSRRNNNNNNNSSPSSSSTQEGGGPFDFSGVDVDGSGSSLNTTILTGIPSINTSMVPSEQNSKKPSMSPSTSKPSHSAPPSGLPSDYPSLEQSSIPSESTVPSIHPSNNPSNIASSNPTYTPTEPVQPAARPPILPFGNITEENVDFITTFCVIADVPYTQVELDELPNQIATQMEGCEFLVHLGDIFIGDTECNIEDYIVIHDVMLQSHVPAFVVPGDNEWNDCQRPNIEIGWDHWTDHFLEFENNWNHTFSVMRQPDYEENFYFIHKRTLFFGLNIVAGRVHDETEWKTRLKSEFLWVKDIMELNLVDMETADGVILMAHAHPSEDHQEFFNAFRMYIKNDLENQFPVLYLHGDGHNFLNTHNFHNQPNFLRIQHEGGTNEPVLKIMAGPQRIGPRTNAYNAFQYDRQLELMNNKNNNNNNNNNNNPKGD